MYPPTVTDAPVHMVYPSTIPKEKQLAMGQEVFGLLPGLCMYATLWLREHNRVCDILKREHPTWSDEQLFQTARLILIGEDRRCRVAQALWSPMSRLPGQAPRTWMLVGLRLRVVARVALEAGGVSLAAFWGLLVLVHRAKIAFGPSTKLILNKFVIILNYFILMFIINLL